MTPDRVLVDMRTAMRERHSTRRYAERPAPDQVVVRLAECIDGAEHLIAPGARVARVDGRAQVAQILTRFAGIYGLIEGAPHMLIGLLRAETDEQRLDLGYVGEQVVLEATRLGLASCWITGTYSPEQAAQSVELEPGEVAAAAIALGYPRTDKAARLHDTAIHRLSGGHRRRTLSQIVFDGEWGRAWSPEDADPVLVEVLECARLAPSATNRQPWRFVVREDAIALALTGAHPIDGGIVMAHVALAAAELDRPGRWNVQLGDAELARRIVLPKTALPVGQFVW